MATLILNIVTILSLKLKHELSTQHTVNMTHHSSQVSADLIWEIARTYFFFESYSLREEEEAIEKVWMQNSMETNPSTSGNQNSYLVKRALSGGVRFSRDPLNLTNINSRKVCSTGQRRDLS